MKRRTFLAGLVASASSLPTVSPAASLLRRFGGTLIAAVLPRAPFPDSFDPHEARTRLERELAAACHAPLVWPPGSRRRGAGPLLKSIAPGEGAHTWTLVLREGVLFSDGTPVGPAEIAASLLRSLSRPAGRSLATFVESVRALPAAVEVVTRGHESLPDLPASLSGVASAVVIERDATPVGTGAFIASEAGNGVDLVANPRAADGRAFLDRLLLRPADAELFRRGSAQVAVGPGQEADTDCTIFLALSPHLTPELKERIARAPDRKLLAEVLLAGRARPAGTLLPPGLLDPLAILAAPERPLPPHGDRTQLSLAASDASREIHEVAERLVVDLVDTGVAPTLRWVPPSELETIAASGRYDLLLGEWVCPDRDAGRALAGATRDPVLATAIPREVDSLIQPDPDARLAAARRMEAAIQANGLLIPLIHPRSSLRHAASVDPLPFRPDGLTDWAEVTMRPS